MLNWFVLWFIVTCNSNLLLSVSLVFSDEFYCTQVVSTHTHTHTYKDYCNFVFLIQKAIFFRIKFFFRAEWGRTSVKCLQPPNHSTRGRVIYHKQTDGVRLFISKVCCFVRFCYAVLFTNQVCCTLQVFTEFTG